MRPVFVVTLTVSSKVRQRIELVLSLTGTAR